MIKKIATSDAWDFWQIKTDVYRCAKNQQFDIYGHPMSKRWECTIDHWQRYRSVFGWATDV